MFIRRQSNRSSENNPEHKWCSGEATSSTDDYCRQQQISHYQTAQYNECQRYCHDTARKYSSYNANERGKVHYKSIFHSGIPTTSRNDVPAIPFVPEQEHHKKFTYFFWKLYDDRKKQGA